MTCRHPRVLYWRMAVPSRRRNYPGEVRRVALCPDCGLSFEPQPAPRMFDELARAHLRLVRREAETARQAALSTARQEQTR